MSKDTGIRLETERLVLRDHVGADLNGYTNWLTNPLVMHFVGFAMARNRGEAKKVLRRIIKRARMQHRTEWYLAVFKKHRWRDGEWVDGYKYALIKD